MFQDFSESRALSRHSSGAFLAEAELVACDKTARISAAKIARDRAVRVSFGIKCSGFASAGGRVHCGEWFSEISEQQSASVAGGAESGASRLWRFAQELAVRGVAEVEGCVTAAGGGEIGSCDHGLRFQRFERSASGHFGGYYRCDGDFAIHRDHGNQLAIAGYDGEPAVKLALDFPWDA